MDDGHFTLVDIRKHLVKLNPLLSDWWIKAENHIEVGNRIGQATALLLVFGNGNVQLSTKAYVIRSSLETVLTLLSTMFSPKIRGEQTLDIIAIQNLISLSVEAVDFLMILNKEKAWMVKFE